MQKSKEYLMMKRALILVGILLMALTVSACGSDPTATPVPKKAISAAPTATPMPEPITLRLLSAFDPNVVITAQAVLDVYPAAIEKATNGTVKVEYAGGPETVSPFEQLTPVREGVFDMGITHPGYHSAVNVFGGAQDLAVGSYATREKCGLNQAIREHYRKNADVEYLPAFIGIGNALALKEPISSLDDLAGRTIRVYPGSTGPFIEALGGNAAPMSISEVYSAIDRGVVDGAVAGGSHAVNISLGLHEVARYLIRPDFGEGQAAIIFNGDVWRKLTPGQQKAIQGIGASASHDVRKIVSDDNTNQINAVVSAGTAELIELSGADLEKWQTVWFETTAQTSVLSRGLVEGARLIELADCVNNS